MANDPSQGQCSLRERLKQEIGECFTSDLQAHWARAAVILVDPTLSLLDVAEAVAEDKSAQVRIWMEKALLVQPTQGQIEEWAKEPKARFLSVVVAPFVLAQAYCQ